MVKKTELEQKTITELTILCMGQGLDTTGDKDTLIARLEPEPVVEPPATEPEPEPEPES